MACFVSLNQPRFWALSKRIGKQALEDISIFNGYFISLGLINSLLSSQWMTCVLHSVFHWWFITIVPLSHSVSVYTVLITYSWFNVFADGLLSRPCFKLVAYHIDLVPDSYQLTLHKLTLAHFSLSTDCTASCKRSKCTLHLSTKPLAFSKEHIIYEPTTPKFFLDASKRHCSYVQLVIISIVPKRVMVHSYNF